MINIWVTHNGEIFDFGSKMILIHSKSKLTSQPSQPLLGIIHFSYPRISILPEVEESLVVLNGLLLWCRDWDFLPFKFLLLPSGIYSESPGWLYKL